MTISRGEIWLVDLGYAAKTRPALVLSIEPLDIDRALVTLVPYTTSPRQSRFEVAVFKLPQGRGVRCSEPGDGRKCQVDKEARETYRG